MNPRSPVGGSGRHGTSAHPPRLAPWAVVADAIVNMLSGCRGRIGNRGRRTVCSSAVEAAVVGRWFSLFGFNLIFCLLWDVITFAKLLIPRHLRHSL